MKKGLAKRMYLYTTKENMVFIKAQSKKTNLSLSKTIDCIISLARENKLGVNINVSK